MFVKTLYAKEYFSTEHLDAMNMCINDSITQVIKKHPGFDGLNAGQVLFTNCITHEGLEVNAIISFDYVYDKEGFITYFKIKEIAIYDDDDNEGINYMLDKKQVKDALIAPKEEVIKAFSSFMPSLNFSKNPNERISRIWDSLHKNFSIISNDNISGLEALKIIEKIFRETR